MATAKRLTAIWFLLLAATALSWGFGHEAAIDGSRNAGTAIVLIAFLKIRLVMLEFMELRHAPTLMRIGCELWVIGICTGVVLLYRM